MKDLETKIKRDMNREGKIILIFLILILVVFVFFLGVMVGMN